MPERDRETLRKKRQNVREKLTRARVLGFIEAGGNSGIAPSRQGNQSSSRVRDRGNLDGPFFNQKEIDRLAARLGRIGKRIERRKKGKGGGGASGTENTNVPPPDQSIATAGARRATIATEAISGTGASLLRRRRNKSLATA